MNSFRVANLLGFTSIRKGNPNVVVLTILILTLVGLNLLFVPSLLGSLVSGANDKLITTYSGDIVVTSGSDKAPLLDNVQGLLTSIMNIHGVVAATTRITLGAQMSFNGNRTSAVVFGMQPDLEQQVFKINQSMIEGDYLTSKDRDQILLGMQVAGADKPDIELYSRSLQGVHAGDKIKITFGNGVEKQYTVKGIFYTEFIQTDVQAFITQAEFESLMPNTKDHTEYVHIKTADPTNTQSIITQISDIRSGLKILTWQDYAGIVRSMTDSFNVIRTIMNIVNILVAGITVFIVTYIDVTNRRRQIGIQLAIGITPSSIMMAYLMRVMFLAVLGITLASLLFFTVVIPLEAQYPFRFPFGSVYLLVGLLDLTYMAVTLLGVSMVAVFLPVYGVTRMKIVDAIWG